MSGKILSIICLAVGLVTGTSEAQTLQGHAFSSLADSAGYIKVLCRQHTAAVYLDSSRAVSPDSVIQVKNGTHRVTAFHNDRSLWIKPQFIKDIMVHPGDTVQVQVVLYSTMWIDTNPTGADVYVDGVHAGLTPMQVMLKGPSVLELKKYGYRNRLMQIEPGEQSMMLCTLIPRYQVREGPAFSRRYVYSAAALSLAANVCGYLFKRAADTEYGRYESASGPGAMNSHFSKTKQYDDISAVCYGVAEVSLGAALFMVIRNMGSK